MVKNVTLNLFQGLYIRHSEHKRRISDKVTKELFWSKISIWTVLSMGVMCSESTEQIV